MVLFYIPITGELVGAVLGVGIGIYIFWFCRWIIPAVNSTTTTAVTSSNGLERRVTELEKVVGHMQAAQFE